MALTGLGTGSDPFLPCMEKDALLPEEDSRGLPMIPDLRVELGSRVPLLEIRPLMLAFKEEFSLPAWRGL